MVGGVAAPEQLAVESVGSATCPGSRCGGSPLRRATVSGPAPPRLARYRPSALRRDGEAKQTRGWSGLVVGRSQGPPSDRAVSGVPPVGCRAHVGERAASDPETRDIGWVVASAETGPSTPLRASTAARAPLGAAADERATTTEPQSTAARRATSCEGGGASAAHRLLEDQGDPCTGRSSRRGDRRDYPTPSRRHDGRVTIRIRATNIGYQSWANWRLSSTVAERYHPLMPAPTQSSTHARFTAHGVRPRYAPQAPGGISDLVRADEPNKSIERTGLRPAAHAPNVRRGACKRVGQRSPLANWTSEA